jgi:hypothetical protein
MSDDFFEDLFKTKSKSERKKEKKKLLSNLYLVPKKDKGKNVSHFQPVKPNTFHQMDLLFLPDDNGFRYALVVTDVGNRITDAEPLKTKNPNEVLEAVKKIYSRDILKEPKRIQVDSGSEFKGPFAKYFEDKHIGIKVAKPQRHRQQGIVERRNGLIASALFKRMSASELLTGEVAKEWVQDLPKVIKSMNKHTISKKSDKPKKESLLPSCEGKACKLLPIGTKVRVALDVPQDVASGQRLHGEFRATDIRWNSAERIVKDVILAPNQPPLYLLDGPDKYGIDNEVAYTKNQLQVIPKDEEAPSGKLVYNVNNREQFTAEKIVGKKKIRNKIYYHIKWLGFPSDENTWEPLSTLKDQIPDMIRQYEESIKDT